MKVIFLILCAAGVLNATAEVAHVLPLEGAVVPILSKEQKAYLAAPTVRRVAGFDDPITRAELAMIGWGPRPVVFVWSGVEWNVGPAELEVRRASDGRTVFCEDVSLRTRNAWAVYNLESGESYLWQVRVAGEASSWRGFKTEVGPRLLAVEGVPNFRDIGGYIGMNGRRVRQGLLYRSSCANRTSTTNACPGKVQITGRGQKMVCDRLKIRTDLDLRSAEECRGVRESPFGLSVRWEHIPSGCYHWMTNSVEKSAFAKCFRVVNNPENLPLVFHCVSGQDRTGTLAFILNALLGVSEEELSLDWEMTVFWNPAVGWFSRKARYEVMLKMFNEGFEGATLQEKVEQYAISCGIAKKEVEVFRQRMLCASSQDQVAESSQ